MASSLNDLTLSFRNGGHKAAPLKVMRPARYLPEMSLPTLSLKLSNYTGQEPACGITIGRAQIAHKSDDRAFLIALCHP